MSAAYAKRFQAVFLCRHPKGPKMSVRDAAKYLRKSREFVNKWVQRYKETKCVDDHPDRGSKRAAARREDKVIFRLFSKNPTFFLRKGQASVATKGINIGILILKRRLEENNVAWRMQNLTKIAAFKKERRKFAGVGTRKC
ncbi:hypothetical protein WH47_01219 [Habropoda laboriosa]|uniref:Histone-lysine N-methyltransferase SETMAR n=1 Tax=Habropoda laboriosa TaxID=597456 RepID=A0A0L7QK16_9HYME|nr:hypothetical protein WH47_01219 [Habropoda laboriosa]